VQAARKALNMTQGALAAKAMISVVYCCRIETGWQMPSVKVITRLARVLKTTRGKLIG
jgi:predicted transcriptional regulator